MPSLVEEARAQAKGAESDMKITWNTVKYGGKKIVVEKQLPSPTQRNVKAADIPVNSVQLKAEHKAKCDLCSMWYEASSVKYKAPNYRLIELRKQWGIHQTGRRFETASYLYANAVVCAFCTQFFDEKYKMLVVDNLEEQDVPPSPISTVKIERTDLTLGGRRTYMSSCVDEKLSDYAISPPYLIGSKSRREVDPWWELSFQENYHFHEISFACMGGVQKALSVCVMIFDEELGFEDPFLDSASGRAKVKKEFVLPERPESTLEEFTWILPGETSGTVVRVQMRGLQPLHLLRINVFQGDKIVDALPTGTYDGEFAHPGAYSTLSPEKIQHTLAFSPLRPRETLKDMNRKRMGGSPKKGVVDLAQMAEATASAQSKWLKTAQKYAMWFNKDELISIREKIFDDIVRSSKGGTFITNNSKGSRPGSRGGGESEKPSMSYDELITTALEQTTERIEFSDLWAKLRQIMIQIDLKSNLKALDAIGTSKKFFHVAEDDELQLRRLQMSFDFMAERWDRIDALRVAEHDAKKKAVVPGMISHLPDVFPVERGCTWAQLCVILNLWCKKRARLVPAYAYLEKNLRGNDFFDPESTMYDDDETQKGPQKFGSDTLDSSLLVSESDIGGDGALIGQLGSDSLNMSKAGGSSTIDFPIGASKVDGKLTLLGTVRSRSILPVLNTSFAEFKLGTMEKKVAQYPTFPKKLTADFDKIWVKPKAAVEVVEEPKVDESDLLKLTKRKTEGPITFDEAEIRALTTPFPDNKPNPTAFRIGGSKKGFFTRICSLCSKRFPKKAIRNFVILKHVITLRRSWDPSIIPKKMAMLEEGMGMYNLVPVCAFCSQYFDPDFEGGIAYPLGEKRAQPGDKAPLPGALGDEKKLKAFFDARFPIKAEVMQDIFVDERALKSRAGARRVREIADALERERLEAEMLEEEKAKGAT